ncbi:MAG: hypothetical protein WAN33_01335 [Candidatus Acidiferrales bacterium]
MLNRFGLGLTANTSTSSQSVTGTASAPQGSSQMVSLQNAANTAPSFSSAFLKFSLYRGKYQLPSKGPVADPTSAIYMNIVTTLQGSDPNAALQPQVLQNYKAWQNGCMSRFTQENMASGNRNQIFFRYYAQVVGVLFDGSTPDCTDSAPIATLTDPGALAAQAPQKRFIGLIVAYMASVSVFESELTQMLTAATKPALSLEYDFKKPLNQPTTSTIKLVGSRTFGANICAKTAEVDSSNTVATKRFTGTINLGGEFYDSTPSGVPGAGAFRDAQAGSEIDVAFCTATKNWIESFFGNSTIGLTYYYQDQVSPSILKVTPSTPVSGITIVGLASTTSQVFAQKGPISFIQLKYGFGVGKNVKFPIAVSWSNRTDLITHSLWSAQFGVSYDFSSLFGSSNSSPTSPGGQQ